MQVTAGVQYLDSSLCSGLDQLVVKVLYLYSLLHVKPGRICILSNCILQVPALKSPTPALYSSTREAAVSCLTLATTYLASFTLAQIVLKVGSTLLTHLFVAFLSTLSSCSLCPRSHTPCRPLTPAWRLPPAS